MVSLSNHPMDMYRDFIIDLFKNPLNKRALPHADLTGSGANVTCGDRVRIYAKLSSPRRRGPQEPEGDSRLRGNDIITELTFEGEGCAISMAAASLLTEEANGKTLEEVAAWGTNEIFELLGTDLGPSRVKCGLLALETLQKAHITKASSKAPPSV